MESMKAKVFSFLSSLSLSFPNLRVSQPMQQSFARYPLDGNSRWSKFKFPKINIVLVIIVILLMLGSYIVGAKTGSQSSYKDNRPEPIAPIAKEDLNKEFGFPIKDPKGEVLTNLKYKIISAELADSFIWNGRKLKSVKGRQILILNIEITNTYKQAIEIYSADYVRLTVNNQKKTFAPDFHNDPVKVQAISTKPTRLGFPINDTDKNLTLLVGEIKSNNIKETVKLKLK